MKRSQMLQFIKEALHPHLPQWQECPDFIAESVLQVVEGGNPLGEGMTPPWDHDIYYRTFRNGGTGHEWEPE